ncbi:MAG: NADH-quinone oxidoreductase subunit A [Acidobacteriota bacterium]|nr:MAG: NADH-quinone oxidoreductase subunit A [Acidobacteriota bacterium]
MSESTWGLLFLVVIAMLMPAGIIFLSWVAGRPRGGKSATDLTPYECGKKPFESARQRFSVKFYLVAMLFVIFDIEAVFLYPWAVELKKTSSSAGTTFILVEMLVFLGIVVVGYVYVWGRGALEWDR